ncbi:helix-turn-helix domain-containing protein [Methylorubrum zatmanii]
MATDLSTMLREGREKAGLTREQAAELFGVSVQAVVNWENGSSAPDEGRVSAFQRHYKLDRWPLVKFISDKRREQYRRRSEKLAEARRIAEENARLIETIAPNADISKDTSTDAVASQIYMALDIPVLGVSMGGSNHDFQFNGETVDYVRRPAGIAKARRPYAVYVVGESMYPAYKEGALIYVNPDKPAAIGDDVVIELISLDGTSENGPAYIKRLKKRSPTIITVEQFNPAKDISFKIEQIKTLHRVVPWNELLGI